MVTAVQGTQAQDTVKGASILADARKALGGEDKLKAVQRLELKGKSAHALGNNNIEGDFEFQMELPDKFRRKEALSMNGNGGVDIVQTLNGAVASQKAEFGGPGGAIGGFDGGGDGGNRGGGRGRGNLNIGALLGGVSTEGLTPEAAMEAEHKAIGAEMGRMAMALLLTPSSPVAWVGTAESPEGKADVLEFKTSDGVDTKLMVAEKTRLPLMMSWVGVAPQLPGRGGQRGGNRGNQGGGNRGRGGAAGPQQAPLQMYFSDYKTVNGIKLPHLIQRGANGETSEELVVKSYRINPTFKAEIFEK